MPDVTEEGSAYGATGTVSQNLRLKDDKAESTFSNLKIILTSLQQMINPYSFPVDQKELCAHLSFLSARNMVKWVFVICACLLFGTMSVDACPEPSARMIDRVVISVIHPCNILVDLTQRGIEDLRFKEVCPQLQDLNISFNNIEHILTKLFSGMTSLGLVDLSFNKLGTVRKDNFNGSAIQRLYLSNNQIAFLFEGAFDGLEDTLGFLTLAFNDLQSLPKGVFNNLKGVTFLDMSFNNLSVVDRDAFKGMDDLRILKLQGNRLTNVSGWLPSVRSQLDLSMNKITTTEGLPQDPNLHLNLTGNPLACSQENEGFIKWCSQTENCYLDAKCDDSNSDESVKPHNIKSEGESHPTPDPNIGKVGTQPYTSGLLAIVVSVLVGCYYALANGI